ncbi:MAG: hypothetical protein IKG67_08535 [Parasporobacterium sp.]|nr:hypothetical protein [Parasporobacterium sp.]
MKTNKKTHWLRNTLLILIGCAIIGLILSAVLFMRDHNRTSVSATLSFTFDGAQNGVAPNGYAFDANEILSEEILTEALENAGLSGRYTVEDIVPDLAVQGIYPNDLVAQMTRHNSLTEMSSMQTLSLSEYHPTVYRVVLYKDFDPSISKSEMTNLLQNILVSYQNWFEQTYAMKTIEGIQVEELGDYDYFQQLEILQFKLQQSAGYADEMAAKGPSFLLNGKGFSDLSLQFNNLLSSDLSRLNATMTMNALSLDLDRLRGQYKQEIKELENRLAIKTNLMNNLDNLISNYGKNGVIYLSTSDSFNKVDVESSGVYDMLVDIRNQVSNDIAVLNTQIANYTNKLEELNKGEEKETEPETEENETSAEEKQTVTVAEADETDQEEYEVLLSEATMGQKKEILDAGISRLVGKSNVVIDSLAEMVEAFNATEINDLTVTTSSVKYKAPSIFSGTFIVLALKTAGPICALGLMAALVLIIISRKKENRYYDGRTRTQ